MTIDDSPIGDGPFALLVDALFAEIASVPPAQRQGFLRAVGARIAGRGDSRGAQTAEELAAIVNRVWARGQWGHAEFSFAENGLLIVHSGLPAAFFSTVGHPSEIFGPLLEGAYQAWLRPLGGNATLVTRVTAWAQSEIRLLHGPRPT